MFVCKKLMKRFFRQQRPRINPIRKLLNTHPSRHFYHLSAFLHFHPGALSTRYLFFPRYYPLFYPQSFALITSETKCVCNLGSYLARFLLVACLLTVKNITSQNYSFFFFFRFHNLSTRRILSSS